MKITLELEKKYSENVMIIFPIIGKRSLVDIKKKYPGAELELRGKNFKGSEGEKLICSTGLPGNNTLMMIGAGTSGNPDNIRKLARNILIAIKEFKLKRSAINLAQSIELKELEIINFIDYLNLNSYSFNRYISKKDIFSPEEITILVNNKNKYQRILKERSEISGIVDYVRDLINETPAIVTPEYMKKKAIELSGRENVDVEIFDDKRLIKEKLNGLINVGRGSKLKPLMAKISYTPDKFKNKIAIVGKGITYDSGGLNIKTGSHMSTMKSDMSGSAVALGIIDLISQFKLPVKLISFLPLAENMPGSGSYKPDDIILFRNGKSVEILNTDAEGRLVLADAIIMASEENPDYIIELSTLTGSIVNALGTSIAGLFTLDKSLSRKLKASGESTGEFVWEMPLYQSYKKSISSKISDLKNAGYGNASSIKAGLFLNEFSGKVPFAHIDIAGTAFIEKESEYHSVSGATGFGIRLLYNFLKSISID
ncbi:MAG: leucyl aminopeptidase [Candidatus Aminicenantes bacterium]|nr:leucyl aminopeptidase [Candidatus Aminicenantes bacterium]